MSKKILVSGSIAYDFIMEYDGVFREALLEDHLDHINVAFSAKTRKMHFGGCGGNIAYSLKLLEEDPVLYGVAGRDFNEYQKWLRENDISLKLVGLDERKFTATANILTDKTGNQITIFSPGAMESTDKDVEIENFDDIGIAILSPDICERTVRIGKKLVEASVPYFFDPGQMTPAFKVEDLKYLLENAYGFISNHYEVNLLCERLGISHNDISGFVDISIETLGEKGAILRLKDSDKQINIASVQADSVVDPTGCGDAFRAGVLSGLNEEKPPVEACKMGALAATYVVESEGTQGHIFTKERFLERL